MPPDRFRKPSSKYTYGVLVGRVTEGQENPGGRSPHYEILVDAGGTPYRVAVNIQSVEGSEVLAYFDANYKNNTKLDLSALVHTSQGFSALTNGPGGAGLDYLRDNLFPIDKMAPIPPDGRGVTLSALIDAQIERAKKGLARGSDRGGRRVQ